MSEATSGVGWITSSVSQDVGHGVDQQADDLLTNLGDDDHVRGRRLGEPEAQARGQVDDRQHRAAQVDHAAHEGGDCGSAVAGVQPRISRTAMMSTQNSCAPMRKEISSRGRRRWLVSDVVHDGYQPVAASAAFRRERIGAAGDRDDGVDVEDQGHAAVARGWSPRRRPAPAGSWLPGS